MISPLARETNTLLSKYLKSRINILQEFNIYRSWKKNNIPLFIFLLSFCNKIDREDLHDAMHAAAVLYLHFVLLDSNVIVAVIHVNTAIFGSQPHRGLIRILFRSSIIDTRYVTTQRYAACVCAWNVVRVRIVGARATAKCTSKDKY